MCFYCGCRELPLIIDFVAEHEQATRLGAGAVAAMDSGDLVAASELFTQLATELRAHWQGEENGLFQAMAKSEEYADYVAALVTEHRDLAALLDTADVTRDDDRAALRAAIAELAPHIRKEEDGLFPAALTALGGDDWNRSIAAWHDAHPNSQLRTHGT